MLFDNKISMIDEQKTLIGVLNPYENREKLQSLAKKR